MTRLGRYTTLAVLILAGSALLAMAAGCGDDRHGPRYQRDYYYQDRGYDQGAYGPPQRGFRPPPPRPVRGPYEDRDDYKDRVEDWEDKYDDWKDDYKDWQEERRERYEDRYDD